MTRWMMALSLLLTLSLMLAGCGDDEESGASDMAMDVATDTPTGGSGGASTGGTATGGMTTGGATTGGTVTGGMTTGGGVTGGMTTGGATTGGMATGGMPIGGMPMMGPIELVGTWDSNFGGQEVITETMWTSPFTSFTLVRWDNMANVAVLLQSDDGTDFANTYSVYAWTEIDSDSFYYCTTAFGAATPDEAEMMAITPDDSMPDTGGCNGFPWTQLTRATP